MNPLRGVGIGVPLAHVFFAGLYICSAPVSKFAGRAKPPKELVCLQGTVVIDTENCADCAAGRNLSLALL
jgi:hypothetical protein